MPKGARDSLSRERCLFLAPRFLTAILLVGLIASSFAAVDAQLATPAPVPGGGGSRPSILLVTIDTLRADHVGSYGYPRGRTDNLDALAARGVRFETVRTPSRFTGPAHISLMTGLLPGRHSVVRNGRRLHESVPTLVEPLRAAGYRTAAFVGGWTTTDRASGLPSRFDVRGDVFGPLPWLRRHVVTAPLALLVDWIAPWLGIDPDPPARPAGNVNADAFAWLEDGAESPFFAWVHYFDPHLPYDEPTGASQWYQMGPDSRAQVVRDAEALEQMRAWYDDDIAIADWALGELLERAEHAAGSAGLLAVVTSDHGESMGEHGLYWERDLYEATQRVPLVVAGRGVRLPEGSTIEAPAALVDIAPTVLELVGLAPPPGLDGRSWAGSLRGDGMQPAGPVIMRLDPEPGEQAAVSVADRRFKLIRREPGWMGHHWVGGSTELYDLDRDPNELANLAPHEAKRVEKLERWIVDSPRADVGADAVSEDDAERLRSLGYAE